MLQMAKDKKSFILYVDQKDLWNKLPDEIAGKLIKHIYSYVSDENPTSNDLIIEIAFEPIKQQLKRDLKLFEEKRVKRSEAGIAGANKRWQEIAKDNNRINDITKIADNVNVNDNVNAIDNINYQALLDFVNKSFGRNFKIVSDKIQRSYKARLKEGYKKEDIIQAIKNCKDNKFHKDNNYQYCTPEYFSRSETLDKYVDRTIVTESDSILAILNK
jgi:uncharacterized phage protein (TIGR02220 family)